MLTIYNAQACQLEFFAMRGHAGIKLFTLVFAMRRHACINSFQCAGILVLRNSLQCAGVPVLTLSNAQACLYKFLAMRRHAGINPL